MRRRQFPLLWGDRLGDAFDELIVKLADSVRSPDGEWLQIDPRWAHLPWAQALTRAGARDAIDGGQIQLQLLDRAHPRRRRS